MIRIILIRPEDPRNIGSVVRAAANFGAEAVRLVAPARWDPEVQAEARVASSGAWELMEPVLCNSITEAAAGCDVLVGTSARRRDHPATPVTPVEFFRKHKSAKVALVFGPESQGLTAEELNLCHEVIAIPTNPKFASLNLAQAVLILLYEAARNSGKTSDQPNSDRSVATLAEQEALLHQLATDAADNERAAARVRHWLHRSQPSPEELAALRRLLKP